MSGFIIKTITPRRIPGKLLFEVFLCHPLLVWINTAAITAAGERRARGEGCHHSTPQPGSLSGRHLPSGWLCAQGRGGTWGCGFGGSGCMFPMDEAVSWVSIMASWSSKHVCVHVCDSCMWL